MKTKLSVLAIALVILCDSWVIPESQTITSGTAALTKVVTPPTFAYFRTHKQGKDGATSTWSLVNDAGISGFVLQRTYEDPEDPYSPWEDIYAVPNGNGNGRSFKFTDEGLYPGFISYRVSCVNGGVCVGNSTVNTIQIVQH